MRHKASLLVLFTVVIVDLVGFGIVMPVLPFYAKSYGASAGTLGLLFTSYSAAQIRSIIACGCGFIFRHRTKLRRRAQG